MSQRRVILHADLNNFYASVSCLCQPELREQPVAVCGDPEQRHGIVLAKNMPAKRMGVITGQAIWQARQLCPGLNVVIPTYEDYVGFSHRVRDIFSRYTDHVQPFGIDEAWLDVSGGSMDIEKGVALANHLRHAVREETGLTLSVGVSDNRVFAKLGSDLKKPDAVSVVTNENRRTVLDPLPVSELLFIGRSTTSKLHNVGIYTIGQLAAVSPQALRDLMGKTGEMLWCFAHGDDRSEVLATADEAVIKSVGNSITAAHDVENDTDARITLYGLCESVASRLRKHGFQGRTVKLWVRNADLSSFIRQCTLKVATDNSFDLFQAAYDLLYQNWTQGKPLRSLGVTAGNLTKADTALQMSFLPEDRARIKQVLLEHAIDDLRERFGHFAVQRAIMIHDHDLGEINPEEEHTVHPEPYFKTKVG